MTFIFSYPFLFPFVIFFFLSLPTHPPRSFLADASYSSSSSSARPPLCSNRFVNVRKLTNCSSLGFSRVPDRRSLVYGDTIVLHLANNRFTVLLAQGFRFLPFLQLLDLSRNAIVEVSPAAFEGLANLDALDLSYNRLTDVPSDAFVELRFLTSLKLRGNPLLAVDKFAFASTPKLSSLDLAECRIALVGPTVFAALSNLRALFLHGNLLRTLDESSLGKVPLTGQLRLLTLYRNPWHCDCRLRWLKLFVESENVTYNGPPEMTSCVTPKRLKDGAWCSLENRRFACAPELYKTPPKSRVVVEEFDSHNVTCRTTMDPVSSMLWYVNGRKLNGKNSAARKNSTSSSLLNAALFGVLPTKTKAYSILEFAEESPNSRRVVATSILQISPVSNATAGEFKCRAKNVAGVIESTTTIIVKRRHGVGGGGGKGTSIEGGNDGSTKISYYDEDGFDDGNGTILNPDDEASSSLKNSQRRNGGGSKLLNGTVVIGGVITGVVLVCFFLSCGAVVFCFAKTNNFKFRNGSSDSVVFRQYGASSAEVRSSSNVTASTKFANGAVLNGNKKRSSISTDLDAIPELAYHRGGENDKRDDDASHPLLQPSCVGGDSGGGVFGVGGIARCVSATYIAATSGERVGENDEEEEYQRPIAPVDAYPTASIHAALIRDLPRSQSVPTEVDPCGWVNSFSPPPMSAAGGGEAMVPLPLTSVEEGEEMEQSNLPFIPASSVIPPQLTVVHDGVENPVYATDDLRCGGGGGGVSPLFSIAGLPPFDSIDPSAATVSIYTLAPASVASPEGVGSYCPSLETDSSLMSGETPSASSALVVSIADAMVEPMVEFPAEHHHHLHHHQHHHHHSEMMPNAYPCCDTTAAVDTEV